MVVSAGSRGSLSLSSDVALQSSSGAVSIATGSSSDDGQSGSLSLQTGASAESSSGSINIAVGASTANGGAVSVSGGASGAGVGGGWQHLFTGRATGSVRAKLERVQDGQAFVTVTFDRVRYLADISEYVSSTAMGRETTAGLQIQGGRLTVDLVGEGTLVWDLDRGRAASLELELDQTVDISFEAEIHEKSMVERMKMIGGYAAKYAVSDELPEDE